MEKRFIIGLVALILIIAAIVWLVNREDAAPTPVLSVSALNQTKNVSATDVQANAEDVIVYTLTAENQTDEVIPGYIIEANISGITDKATLVDASGASYNAGTDSLVWTPMDIEPHQSISQRFSVRINPLSESADTVLRIKFNNELAITVQPGIVSGNNTPTPVPTVNPPTSYVAPTSGASEWIPALFAGLVTLGFVFRKRFLGITSQA